MTPDPLLDAVRAWMAEDPDPACQAELRDLLQHDDRAELADRFGDRLRFGTAGLRGELGAGPTRMNVATVRRTTAGLAAYLSRSVPGASGGGVRGSGVSGAGVVIGYDARHGSARFADETARVVTGAGLRAFRLPGRLPTPTLAFAVRHLGAAAGVMITASHNPARDNGYKVYLADGAQIVPPADTAISAAIDEVGPLGLVPLGDPGEAVGSEIIADYLRAIIAALPDTDARDLTTVYTPLHGVGRDVLLQAFDRAGFAHPHVVASQAEPDPDFPTVARPNPEEPGALDLATAEARRIGADLLIANDPDADRLAVAIPSQREPGGWRVLSGDELGALLGDHLLTRRADPHRALAVTTVVSSSLLGDLARAAGAQYAETLTGFKWIMHEATQRSAAQHSAAQHAETRLVFGYEEALGYAVNDVVRDKDGISAALAIAGLAADSKRHGLSLADRLDDIARRFGLHGTEQFSLELPGHDGQARIGQIMAELRVSPPVELLGHTVHQVDDLAAGVRRFDDGSEEPLSLPRSDVVIWRTREHDRVVARPSGTEPKLKFYLEVVVPVGKKSGEGLGLGEARARAAASLTRLRDQLRPALEPFTSPASR